MKGKQITNMVGQEICSSSSSGRCVTTELWLCIDAALVARQLLIIVNFTQFAIINFHFSTNLLRLQLVFITKRFVFLFITFLKKNFNSNNRNNTNNTPTKRRFSPSCAFCVKSYAVCHDSTSWEWGENIPRVWFISHKQFLVRNICWINEIINH